MKPHAPETQVGVEFAGTEHVVQLVPQAVTSFSALQTPPQLFVPEGHIPLQAVFCAIHAPEQGFCPEGQVGRHIMPSSQVALPPVGT